MSLYNIIFPIRNSCKNDCLFELTLKIFHEIKNFTYFEKLEDCMKKKFFFDWTKYIVVVKQIFKLGFWTYGKSWRLVNPHIFREINRLLLEFHAFHVDCSHCTEFFGISHVNIDLSHWTKWANVKFNDNIYTPLLGSLILYYLCIAHITVTVLEILR